LEVQGRAHEIGEPVFVLGEGPFSNRQFGLLLAKAGLRVRCEPTANVGDAVECNGSPIFVLGRDGVAKATLASLMEPSNEWEPSFYQSSPGVFHPGGGRARLVRTDSGLRAQFSGLNGLFSQELFLHKLFTGSVDSSSRHEHLASHPAFISLSREFGFTWPSTEVGEEPAQTQLKDADKWPQMGMLSAFDYHTGNEAAPSALRSQILTKIYFEEYLPHVDSAEYVAQWGTAKSARRLQKLANTMAALCRSNKRREAPSVAAICHWEEDLAWLKSEFYDGVYDGQFGWPLAD
jgi:hypothetical protein